MDGDRSIGSVVVHIKEYPMLYKNTMQWQVQLLEVEASTMTVAIVVTFGKIGGKLQTQTKEVTSGKAGRDVCAQAILLADRMYTDKREKTGYTDNPHMDNTSVSVMHAPIYPMLAQTYSDKRKKNIRFPCIGQPKWDGIRCISHVDPMEGVTLRSRRGVNFFNMNHIRNDLMVLFERMQRGPTFYIDGELYSHDLSFEDISGAVRSKTANDTTNTSQLSYVIYDCFDVHENRKADSFESRYRELVEHLTPSNSCFAHLILCPSVTIQQKEDIDVLHDAYVKDGFEGLILRNVDSVYAPDKRSYDLQKYKKFDDAEFTIVGFKEGTGVDKGLVIWTCRGVNCEFDVRPSESFSKRKELFDNGTQYLGKQLTVRYNGLTRDGCPRFPVGKGIREDGM